MSAASDFLGGATPKFWVSGTTYPATKVVASPSDFQYYMRKSAGGGTTDPASDPTNWQPTGDRAVKSVQRGTASPTVTAITISAVNIAKCQTYCVGFGKDNSGIVQAVIGGYLSNSTTLAVNGGGGYTGGGIINYEVVERY